MQTSIANLNNAIENLEAQKGSLTPDTAIGRISRMEAIEATSVNATKMANYQQQLLQLQSAQQRLDTDPEFGFCITCGEAIPAGRLQLIPEATECVNCAK